MADLGRYNRLRINRFVDFGAYVDGGDLGEILVPIKYIPGDLEEDDEIDVFVHLDGEERYVATTENVKAEVGECAYMEITAVSDHGAFADWGLVKNLFIPFREQKFKLIVGDKAIIYVYIDEITNRLAGTTKIENYIKYDSSSFREKERVKVLIYRKTPSGFLAIIENRCLGMIYQNQVFRPLNIGDKVTAYIKKIRDDRKIDLTLHEEGYGKVEDFSDVLLEFIEEHKETTLTDKSSPEDIKKQFGVSKKVFKQAVGKLYKQKKISIVDKKIRFNETQE